MSPPPPSSAPPPAPVPRVILWYQVYCWILAVVYALTILLGIVVLALPAETLGMGSAERVIMGVICIGFGLPLLGMCVVPFLFHPRPWLWIYGFVLIALGLTSCCFLPFCIPLLIHWIKPETQRHFGRVA